MHGEQLTYGLLAGLAIALLVAAFTDIRSRTISNWLNLGIAVTAPLFWWATGLSLWPGVALQIGVAFGCFVLCAILFALRQMGGGDVKLLTALALWIDPANFLRLVVLMALIGGLLTVVIGSWHVMRRRTEKLAIPYGLAIASAGLWIIAGQYLPAIHGAVGAG